MPIKPGRSRRDRDFLAALLTIAHTQLPPGTAATELISLLTRWAEVRAALGGSQDGDSLEEP